METSHGCYLLQGSCTVADEDGKAAIGAGMQYISKNENKRVADAAIECKKVVICR